MIRTSFLRVYQPAAAFAAEDIARWVTQESAGGSPEEPLLRRWLVRASLSGTRQIAEGAFLRRVDGETFFCPWHSRLRALVALLTFRGSVPAEVADAFVPEREARRAAAELAELGDRDPSIRSHIVHANWHVPLRWFAAFDDSERILVEDRAGLRIRYETRLGVAKERLSWALEVLESTLIDDDIVGAVKELIDWFDGFDPSALVELDYGTVAGAFEDEELLEDHSAAEVNTCLTALATSDPFTAGRVFAEVSERWAAVRAYEGAN